MRTVGTLRLIEEFKTAPVVIGQSSHIAGKRSSVTKPDGKTEEVYPKSYWPGDAPLDHVVFALKHEPVSLDLLNQVFTALPEREVDRFIATNPTGKYARRIGFLYEQLTSRTLGTKVAGNFVSALDEKRYFTGRPRLDQRWRVRDNLLGSAGFCPVVRRTPALLRKLAPDYAAEIRELSQKASPQLLNRAIHYLYRKETKASFEIEHETVGGARELRFLQVLSDVGKVQAADLLVEPRLVTLQNSIVDSRYANQSFRTNQNYVGQTLPNLQERIHYVCPPPALVKTLMAGLRTFMLRSNGIPSPIRAAVVGFGFVYTHPFEDGNGRLHRLLMHETLASDGYTDPGVVLPLSAGILREPHRYDQTLESFSQTVLKRVDYDLDTRGRMVIKNVGRASGVWRYPDLTVHAEYTLDLIERAVRHDLPNELDVLQRFDVASQAISEVVDLPNRKLQLLLRLLHQNHGKLSKLKRKSEFPELTSNEINRIERTFAGAFVLQD
ncbi:MAG: Fic family protein [Cephaloticoccus sp.]|nr:Fic family protein [Cephaloticoccus sp.]MCF7759708.1 Fic family protein [Cephaloticoccus sp.]